MCESSLSVKLKIQVSSVPGLWEAGVVQHRLHMLLLSLEMLPLTDAASFDLQMLAVPRGFQLLEVLNCIGCWKPGVTLAFH